MLTTRDTVVPRLWLLTLALLAFPARAVIVTINVDETADLVDENPGDGACETYFTTCSLRAAIQESNALGTIDRIDVPAGVYRLTLPGAGEDNALTGDLDITKSVEIAGAGPSMTVIDGNGLDRIFDVHDLTYVVMSGVTIRGGTVTAPVFPGHVGGGIYVRDADLDITESEVSDNSAHRGGGLFADNLSTVSISDSSLRGNSALGISLAYGGAIATQGALDLDRVEISGNNSDNLQGAVVGNHAVSLSVRNSTIANNQNNGLTLTNTELDLINSTIFGNTRNGLDFGSATGNEPLTVRNSIIANNGDFDCKILGTPPTTIDFSGEYNLDSDGSCPLDMSVVDLPSTNPMLGPLGLHGGHTRTLVPLVGSPVIDVGNNARCVTPDQRGAPRPLDGGPPSAMICDMGAVEVLPCEAPFNPDEVLPFFETAAANLFMACYTITNGTDFRILNGGLVTWKARDAFTLQNGFEVHTGGTFEADLDPDSGASINLP